VLTFTSRGAVSAPVTLQVRVGAEEPGALRAGVRRPSRDMTVEEVRAAIEAFTTGRRGPRTRPCTDLVLSGAASLPADVVAFARQSGFRRVTLHGRAEALEPLVDRVALRVDRAAHVPIRPPVPVPWVAVVQLSRSGVATLGSIVEAIGRLDAGSRPERAVLAWPLPGHDGDALPDVPDASIEAHRAIEALGAHGVSAILRGLPPCLDGSIEGRTRNRFYVDADHPSDRARLWVPDVVQYLKPDSCRVCRLSTRCDGVAAPWLERGILGPLEPIRE
jgi:hypothetical protein